MYKQIIIARKDLRMTPGKLSVQVSHGSMAFLSKLIRTSLEPISRIIPCRDDNGEIVTYYEGRKLLIEMDLYEEWFCKSFTKTVLGAKNRNQLLKAKTLAEELGMKEGEDFFLIKDNCYTELEPEEVDENGVEKTLTCIGFKPMKEEIINQIGRKYQLY